MNAKHAPGNAAVDASIEPKAPLSKRNVAIKTSSTSTRSCAVLSENQDSSIGIQDSSIVNPDSSIEN